MDGHLTVGMLNQMSLSKRQDMLKYSLKIHCSAKVNEQWHEKHQGHGSDSHILIPWMSGDLDKGVYQMHKCKIVSAWGYIIVFSYIKCIHFKIFY